jgi:hypothetical protein
MAAKLTHRFEGNAAGFTPAGKQSPASSATPMRLGQEWSGPGRLTFSTTLHIAASCLANPLLHAEPLA